MWGFLLKMGNIIKPNRPIEHEIGTIVIINNKECVVVESENTCDGCVFNGRERGGFGCRGRGFICNQSERKDGKFIIYKQR